MISLPRPAHRGDFRIAVVCALSLEADVIEALFDEYWDDDGYYGKASRDTNAYTTGRIGRHNVVLAHMPGMGKGIASSVASSFRSSYGGIQLALVVGICGGVPRGEENEEILVGDVVISDGIVQYDLGRRLPDGFVRKNALHDSFGRPNAEI
jgi:nucleoside phosphorylase